MSRALRMVRVLLVALALSGCTAGVASTTSTPGSSAVAVADEGGSDLGNDRPLVTHDGLMVRRRVVIAIHPTSGAHLTSLRKELDSAATRRHISLTTVSPTVLDPAVLGRFTPELTLLLPAGDTVTDARRLIDPASSQDRKPPEAEGYTVAPVLVHDLRFTVGSARPAVLARAIAREGILSDALGNYATTFGSHQLDITYTGPLLSDDLVESVRGGIARRAHIQPTGVTVSPRSTTGLGVDMAKEPAPAPAAIETSAAHHHTAALPAVTASSSSNDSRWTLFLAATAALLILLTLTQHMMRRRIRPDSADPVPRG
jgi:hypothetical protein